MSASHIRNIGIVAHVDAGKTTLTEQILLLTGRIRQVGSVDRGTAHMDWLPTEKERGITIISATTTCFWHGHQINLIDTPGHVDFASEVQRSLRVIDGVIVVVSAADGVQAHTHTLWHAIRSMRLPAIFFINKLDRVGADPIHTVQEIQKHLTPAALPLQIPLGWADQYQGVEGLYTNSLPHDDAALLSIRHRWQQLLLEHVAEHDEDTLAHYVDGLPIDGHDLLTKAMTLASCGLVYPILMGAAAKGSGVSELLDTVVQCLPPPMLPPSYSDELSPEACSAIAFKVQREPTMGRMVFARVYKGRIVSRQPLYNATQDMEEKVTQVRRVHANTHTDIGEVQAGDIAALCGLDRTRIGDILGDLRYAPAEPDMPVPIFQVKATPVDPHGIPLQESTAFVRLASALTELEDEDPALHITWNPDIREITVRVMGLIQVEILGMLLEARFGLHASFSPPTVIFKETPAQLGHGHVAYTPVPHFAVLHFIVEPAPRGSGIHYESLVKPRDIKIRYQREVERRVPQSLEQGPKGWEVTDIKVTLVEGADHEQHTHPLDFVAATGWCMDDALRNSGTHLLEPILAFRLIAPAFAGGRICTELMTCRATFEPPLYHEDSLTLEGEMPAATTQHFPVWLQQMTGGKGIVTTWLTRYDLAPPEYNLDPANTQPKRPGVSFKTFM